MYDNQWKPNGEFKEAVKWTFCWPAAPVQGSPRKLNRFNMNAHFSIFAETINCYGTYPKAEPFNIEITWISQTRIINHSCFLELELESHKSTVSYNSYQTHLSCNRDKIFMNREQLNHWIFNFFYIKINQLTRN